MKPRLSISSSTASGPHAALGILPVHEGAAGDLSGLGVLGPTVRAWAKSAAGREGFAGRAGQVVALHAPAGAPVDCLLLAGLGPAGELSAEAFRSALGHAARRVPEGLRGPRRSAAALLVDAVGWNGAAGASPRKRAAASTAAAHATPSLEDCLQAAVEGWILGGYAHTSHRTAAKPQPIPALDVRVAVTARGKAAASARRRLAAAIRAGELVAGGVVLARDLANDPANAVTPVTLARRAREVARGAGLRCRVLDEAAIRRERMGALLGVARGSDVPPRFIVLEHRPRGRARRRPLVLVGKAITFDSGGISIKPAKGMEEMKADMSGGAAVLAALSVIARLGLPYPVVGLIPSAENMISGRAIKPGDVVRSRAGLTIEVVNTDAEGRLILADALDYARRFKPAMVIDLATLTGACVVALGDVASGVMGSDRDAVDAVKRAADRSGERVWELPLFPEYHERLKSETADLSNSGGRAGGAVTAAAFLSRFIEGVPWAHVDIAGPAWSTRVRGYLGKGATGVGVRTLVALARDLAAGSRRR